MFLTDREVERIIDRRVGRAPIDEVLKDMKRFFEDEYEIEILDYVCSKDRIKPLNMYRVRFIVWNMGDAYKYRWDILGSEMEKLVIKTFAESCRKHSLNPDFYDPGDFFMVLTDFQSDVFKRLFEKNEEKIEAVFREYPQIKMERRGDTGWYIFFETEADITKYMENGLFEEIRARYKEAAGKVEGFEDLECDRLWPYSMEEFNGKYHGSWRAFWQ